MADFEHRQFEIGLEFVRWSFAKRNNFSKGSSEPKKYAQVIWVRGRQPHEFFNSNYLFQNGRLPETLMVQLDNCSRENKNKYFFSYCALLVRNKVFKRVPSITAQAPMELPKHETSDFLVYYCKDTY